MSNATNIPVSSAPTTSPTSTMPLLTVSNEVLLEVVSCLEWNSGINALMQVSGRTYYLISYRLFWHNVFWAESTAFK